MIKRFVFRDDDIASNTELEWFKPVHELFVSNHKTHTISIICNMFETNKTIIDYIKSTNYWNIQIHGWEHERYGLYDEKRIGEELDMCIEKIESIFGVTPSKWYLPWNGWTPELGSGHELDAMPKIYKVAKLHGLEADINCDHMGHFMRELEEGEMPKTKTVYFHSWNKDDCLMLPHLIDLTEKYCEQYVRSKE